LICATFSARLSIMTSAFSALCSCPLSVSLMFLMYSSTAIRVGYSRCLSSYCRTLMYL
jgi:hypothetical protein